MATTARSAGRRMALSTVGLTAAFLFVVVASAQFLRASAPRIAAQGEIYQSGTRVAWAADVSISPDGSTVEFGAISNAGKLAHNAAFDFDGHTVRITQIWQVQYSNDAARETTLLKVAAKVLKTK